MRNKLELAAGLDRRNVYACDFEDGSRNKLGVIFVAHPALGFSDCAELSPMDSRLVGNWHDGWMQRDCVPSLVSALLMLCANLCNNYKFQLLR